jgi:hypothetical protein
MTHNRFYSRKKIEEKAEARLADFELEFGKITAPPIPIDNIIEHTYDLNISWEKIVSRPGEMIFGALRPQSRQIVLNEDNLALFRAKPGLERSTKGHELGHWDLFVDQSTIDYPDLPGLEPNRAYLTRSSSLGNVEVLNQLIINGELYNEYKKMIAGKDPPFIKSAVDYYASILSMPRFLIIPTMKEIHSVWNDWNDRPFGQRARDIYDIARLFDVTPSALQVRLEQLHLLYIDWDNKRIYRNRAESDGQMVIL